MKKLADLIQKDNLRMDLLSAVHALGLPDWYIAAGFVRNLVWDHLHGFSYTHLNDVDVIYFSETTIDEQPILDRLLASHPEINWQLKNQASMHIKNGDQPYRNSIHAMGYWPEIETAIGARLCSDSKLVLASPFNISAIFDGYITHNKNREKGIFLSRVKDKNWLELWPKLQLKI